MPSYTFNVYENGKRTDTVFDQEPDPAEVKRSLVNHDGYSSAINVRRVFKTWHIVQENWGYGHGWEDSCAEESYKEARQRLREYRENSGAPCRLIKRKEQV